MFTAPGRSLPPNLLVGKRRLTIQQVLGSGAFGVVYKVIDQESSELFALKDILCQNVSANIQGAIGEAKTLSRISHENIIKIIGADKFEERQNFHVLILTEFCAGGNLNERLSQPSTENQNRKWMTQIAAALQYLHACKIVHRDLKPENVLLSDRIVEDVKLADFGLAREYMALKQADANSWLTQYNRYYMNTFAGTPPWMAPEVFPQGHYTEKADVFSLGVVFFAILERDYVYFNGKKYYGAFVRVGLSEEKVGLGCAMFYWGSNARVTFSPGTQGSNALRRVTLEVLEFNPNDRPTAEAVHKRTICTKNAIRLGETPKGGAFCCSR